MAVKYQDYYEILGAPRSASQDQIQSAYRKLARKYHPDVNKNAGAEDKFKKIGEAYEVLKDPTKRKKYDQLGENWHMGDDFSAPPGWDFQDQGASSKSEAFRFNFDGFEGSGFSDFFDILFGQDSGGQGGRRRAAADPWSELSGRDRQHPGQDHEVDITISLLDAYKGGKKSISVKTVENTANGLSKEYSKSYEVNIPKGVTEGRRLRLTGQGGEGSKGAKRGDLYFKIRIAPHPLIRIRGEDLETDVPVAPWEAALGARISIPLVDGSAEIDIPPGIQNGKKIRVKGKGLGGSKGKAGDLYAIVKIVIPKTLSSKEKSLLEELSQVSSFKPRE